MAQENLEDVFNILKTTEQNKELFQQFLDQAKKLHKEEVAKEEKKKKKGKKRRGLFGFISPLLLTVGGFGALALVKKIWNKLGNSKESKIEEPKVTEGTYGTEESFTDYVQTSSPVVRFADFNNLRFRKDVSLDGLDPSLVKTLQLMDEANIPAVVTSGIRTPDQGVGSSPSSSPHNFGRAIDIIPKAGYTFSQLRNAIVSNPKLVAHLKNNGINVLQELSPTVRNRTGATGEHFHLEKSVGASNMTLASTEAFFQDRGYEGESLQVEKDRSTGYTPSGGSQSIQSENTETGTVTMQDSGVDPTNEDSGTTTTVLPGSETANGNVSGGVRVTTSTPSNHKRTNIATTNSLNFTPTVTSQTQASTQVRRQPGVDLPVPTQGTIVLTVQRVYKAPGHTIGYLYINGKYFCDTLEDTDRGLDDSMSLEEIRRIKIKGLTAIPTGIYDVTLKVVSPRLSQKKAYQFCGGRVPRLVRVKGYEGVLIHIGNQAEDTEGCILTGEARSAGRISNSTATFRRLYNILERASTVKLIVESTLGNDSFDQLAPHQTTYRPQQLQAGTYSGSEVGSWSSFSEGFNTMSNGPGNLTQITLNDGRSPYN